MLTKEKKNHSKEYDTCSCIGYLQLESHRAFFNLILLHKCPALCTNDVFLWFKMFELKKY